MPPQTCLPTPPDNPPETVIRPASGWQPINWGELWRFRELIAILAWRDIKVRYKQTVLGAAWAVLQPAMMMVVFSIFFGRLAGQAEQSTRSPTRSLSMPACCPGCSSAERSPARQ